MEEESRDDHDDIYIYIERERDRQTERKRDLLSATLVVKLVVKCETCFQ